MNKLNMNILRTPAHDESQYRLVKYKFDKGEALKYIFFWGHTNKANEGIGKFVFSQWFLSPFTVDGIEY